VFKQRTGQLIAVRTTSTKTRDFGCFLKLNFKKHTEFLYKLYNASLADNIRKFTSLSNSVKNSAVIYAGKENGKINNVKFVNFKNTCTVY